MTIAMDGSLSGGVALFSRKRGSVTTGIVAL